MRESYSIDQLKRMANIIRRDALLAMYRAGSGHPGGSMSIAEMLSVLYFRIMDVDPLEPQWEDRDRFVLSKGHGAPALYAALAERGYFRVDELETLRCIDSRLQGHPDSKKTPGIDMSTGSLGQGFAAACGMAHWGKKKGKNFRVYTILGDGEIQEGIVWEAAMGAGHFKLDHITAFLDNNNLQIDGNVDEVMSVYPVKDKFQAFGWEVFEADGHEIQELLAAEERARYTKGKPSLILCKTVKGKGISFMENQAGWHGAPINKEQLEQALRDLDGGESNL